MRNHTADQGLVHVDKHYRLGSLSTFILIQTNTGGTWPGYTDTGLGRQDRLGRIIQHKQHNPPTALGRDLSPPSAFSTPHTCRDSVQSDNR